MAIYIGGVSLIRHSLTARTVLLGLVLASVLPSTTDAATAIGCGTSPAPKLCSIYRFHARTNHYRALTNRARLVLVLGPYPHRRAYESWLWQRRRDAAKAAWTRYERSPWLHWPAMLCIHHYEGSWTAYNPAGYYGGVQADWGFMRAYGAPELAKYGGRDARYWSPGDQLHMAWRGYLARGYAPWPNTSAMCGL